MCGAVIAPSPGVGKVDDPRIDGLTGQLASTSKKVFSLTAQLSDLKGARDKTIHELENLAKKFQTETKEAEDHIIVERDWAMSPYKNAFKSVWQFFKAAYKHTAGHT